MIFFCALKHYLFGKVIPKLFAFTCSSLLTPTPSISLSLSLCPSLSLPLSLPLSLSLSLFLPSLPPSLPPTLSPSLPPSLPPPSFPSSLSPCFLFPCQFHSQGRMVYEKNFGADGGYGAKFKKCTNCRQKGHLEFECAQPKVTSYRKLGLMCTPFK